jgi:hypothetical protein
VRLDKAEGGAARPIKRGPVRAARKAGNAKRKS